MRWRNEGRIVFKWLDVLNMCLLRGKGKVAEIIHEVEDAIKEVLNTFAQMTIIRLCC